MTEAEQYVYDEVRTSVYSGFYDEAAIQEMIGELLEEGADATPFHLELRRMMDDKSREERAWPPVTDCDRLDAAFGILNAQGVIALQNAGYTMSDGHGEVAEIHGTKPHGTFLGYCFGSRLANKIYYPVCAWSNTAN